MISLCNECPVSDDCKFATRVLPPVMFSRSYKDLGEKCQALYEEVGESKGYPKKYIYLGGEKRD